MCIEHVSAIKFHNRVAVHCAVSSSVQYCTASPLDDQRQYLVKEECHRVFSVTRHRLLLPFIDYLPSQDGFSYEEFMNTAYNRHTSGKHFIMCQSIALYSKYENIIMLDIIFFIFYFIHI